MNLFYKTEKDSQTWKKNVWLPKGKGGGINQELGNNIYITTYKIDNQQGPIVQHRKFSSIFCINLYEKRSEKKCITESFCCILETSTTL